LYKFCFIPNKTKKYFRYKETNYMNKMGKRQYLTFEQYRDYLAEKGYTLLITKEEYSGTSKIYPGKCPKKHDCNISYSNLKKGGTSCKPCGVENTKKTCQTKYGVDYISQTQKHKDKCKETLMKNYGVDSPMKSEEIRERSKATCREVYGEDFPMRNKDVQENHKASCLKSLGVDSPMKSEEIREKAKATCRVVYGTDYSVQNEEVKKKMRETSRKNYGVDFPSQSEIIKEKIRQTCLAKFGVPSVFQSQEIKAKIREAMIEIYGVAHSLQNPESLEKRKATMLERFGAEHSFQNAQLFEKYKNTMRERYGTEHALQNPEIYAKYKAFFVEHYGVEHPSQVPEILAKMQKSCFKMKEFIFPSGEVVLCQGYENFCLGDLVKEGYDENDIVNGVVSVPVIPYTMEDGNHRYFPDIFIPKENKLIEIKSSYTMEKHLQKNLAKAKACVDMGYVFELRIYDRKGKYTVLDKDLYTQ
jgi:glutathione peroxidase-family protein